MIAVRLSRSRERPPARAVRESKREAPLRDALTPALSRKRERGNVAAGFSHPRSMEIARRERKLGQQRTVIVQPVRDQMMHALADLQHAVDAHHPRFEQHAMLPLGERAPDDDVHVAGLVLDRDERDALRGAGC